MKLFLPFSALVALAACARPEVAPTPSPAPAASAAPAAPAQRAEAPMKVSWVEQGRDEHSAKLLARVDRLAPIGVPVTVEVRVPSGVKLVGPARFTLAPSDVAGVTDTAVELRFDAVPQEDVLLVADVSGPGYGAHAEVPYRFGRPAPAGPAPKADGPHLQLGGHDMGGSVPLKP